MTTETISVFNQTILPEISRITGWTIDKNPYHDFSGHDRLRVSENLLIWFNSSNQRGKIHASLSYGPNNDLQAKHRRSYGDEDPNVSINFDPAKSPEAIARDLQKRLIPDAEKYLAVLLERAKSRNEYEDKVAANVAAIHAAFPLSRTYPDHPNMSKSIVDYYFSENPAGYGDFQVSGDSITVKVHVPPSTAVLIAKLLSDLAESN